MISLLMKSHDSYEMINLLTKKERCNSLKKENPLVCSKYLSSWTGLGRSGHVQSPTFVKKLHVSGPKLAFQGNFMLVRYHFSARKLKSTVKPSKNVVCMPRTFFCMFGVQTGFLYKDVGLE